MLNNDLPRQSHLAKHEWFATGRLYISSCDERRTSFNIISVSTSICILNTRLNILMHKQTSLLWPVNTQRCVYVKRLPQIPIYVHQCFLDSH